MQQSARKQLKKQDPVATRAIAPEEHEPPTTLANVPEQQEPLVHVIVESKIQPLFASPQPFLGPKKQSTILLLMQSFGGLASGKKVEIKSPVLATKTPTTKKTPTSGLKQPRRNNDAKVDDESDAANEVVFTHDDEFESDHELDTSAVAFNDNEAEIVEELDVSFEDDDEAAAKAKADDELDAANTVSSNDEEAKVDDKLDVASEACSNNEEATANDALNAVNEPSVSLGEATENTTNETHDALSPEEMMIRRRFSRRNLGLPPCRTNFRQIKFISSK